MIDLFISRFDPSATGRAPKLEKVESFEPGCWIRLLSPTEGEIRQMQSMVRVPDEFVRYALDEEERPRLDYDDDENKVLILADFPYFDSEGPETRYITVPMGIIIASDCIITISLREAPVLDMFEKGLVKDFYTQYHTRFALQVLLSGAKNFLTMLRYMDKTIDGAERKLEKSVSNNELFTMMQLGKSLVYFTTSLKSNQAVVERLMRSRLVKKYEDDEDLLEDVLIEYNQALEMANIYTSIINGTMDAYASIISNNLNVVMKFMAAMTIVLTVPSLITGFFGSNVPFPHDSEFKSNFFPFVTLVVLCVAAVIFAIWYLKKKDLF